MSYFPSAHDTPGQAGYYPQAAYGTPGYEPGTHAALHGDIGGHGDNVKEMLSNEGYEDVGRYTHGGKPTVYRQAYPPYPEYSQTLSAAQGTAGFLYATQSPTVAPASPLQPYSTEQSRSGYAATPPTGRPYAASTYGHEQSPRVGEIPPSRAQAAFAQSGFPDASLYVPNPQIVPSHGPRELSSTLVGALGPPAASTPTARIESSHRSSTLPHPDIGVPIASPSSEYPYTEYGSPYAEDVDFQFVVETGSSASVTSARSARGRTELDGAEDAPRKRTNSKAPKKEVGFLACYFCRGRKIACNAPPKDAEDRSCEQCSKRKIPCEYPTVSRRGQRNLNEKKRAQPEESFVPRRVRTESHMAMQGSASGYPYGN
ncbi:unnamed protein product [Peniophora sp. CBMAI 1063]|nr:unnamed protein product [Peniophora sp. CBMAI 1063]